MLTIRIVLIIFSVHVTLAYQVIIIGAGAAGIAAYSRLAQNNITDVLILEAENRIGGRVQTVRFGEDVVELGAEWIHGSRGNVAYELAQRYSLVKESRLHFRLVSSSPPDFDDHFDQQLYEIHYELFTEDGRPPADIFETEADYYTRRYKAMTQVLFKHDVEKLKQANFALEYFESDIVSTVGAMSWHDISALNGYRVTEGDLMQEWIYGGYQMVIEIMLNRFPDPTKSLPLNQQIRLKKTVKKIYWKNNIFNPLGVAVATSDGSLYRANMVIFTGSLGVLKNEENSMFVPPLPRSKKEAIHSLGYGSVAKFILYYPQIWWDTDKFSGAGLVWNEDTKNLTRKFSKGPSVEGKSWLLGIRAVHTVRNNPNILSFLVFGPYAPLTEQLPDYILLEGIEFVLEKFFSRRYNITKPNKMIRSFWYTNPHFRGTYSYETVSSVVTPNGPEELSQPLLNERNKPTCLFAGEATHHSYYSTVHGAIESGYREADRIINYSYRDNFPTHSKK